MTFFSQASNKETVKAFAVEDLRNLGLKVPKIEKIVKASRSSISQCKDGGAIFGVPLSLTPVQYHENLGPVPKFLISTRDKVMEHLEMEGLFRKAGSVNRQKELLGQLEDGRNDCLTEAQVFDVTSLIKQFFRELPDSLIPALLQDSFVKAIQLETEEERATALRLLSLLLPLENMSAFRYTLELLHDIADNAHLNRMDSRNLAVCLTPNFFHTKPNSKLVHLQTDAVQISINNAHLIAVVPASIEERVAMLLDMESKGCDSIISADTSTSSKKKRRTGSLSGIVGSIRRSVDKLRSKSRRSVSVPESLNSLNDSTETEYGFVKRHQEKSSTLNLQPRFESKGLATHTRVFHLTSAGMIDSGQARPASPSVGLLGTPMIMKRGDEQNTGHMTFRKRGILSPRSVLTTPAPLPGHNTSISNEDTHTPPNHGCDVIGSGNVSLDEANSSRASGSPGFYRRKGFKTSPFSKHKRSASSGPVFSSPGLIGRGRTRSSNKTKKMIRKLSVERNGKANAADMLVGQRLACPDTSSPAQKLISTSPSLDTSGRAHPIDERQSNEMGLRQLSSGCPAQQSDTERNAEPLVETRCTLRRRARSADGRPLLVRGRPNHENSGRPRVRLPSNPKQLDVESISSLTSQRSAVSGREVDISNPLISDQSRCQINFSLRELPPSGASRTSRTKNHHQNLADFDVRMAESTRRHSGLFPSQDGEPAGITGQSKAGPVLRSESCHVAQNAKVSAEYRRVRSDNAVVVPTRLLVHPTPCDESEDLYFNQTETSILTVLNAQNVAEQLNSAITGIAPPSSQVAPPTETISRNDSGLSFTGSSTGTRSKSSLISTDSGINGPTETLPEYHAQPRDIAEEYSESEDIESAHNRAILEDADSIDGEHKSHIEVRGAIIHRPQHDSLADLKQTPSQVSTARGNLLDRKQSSSGETRRRGMAPVRIPTVFAKNDPRALRIKSAADEVRRRKLSQGAKPEETWESPTKHRKREEPIMGQSIRPELSRQPFNEPIKTSDMPGFPRQISDEPIMMEEGMGIPRPSFDGPISNDNTKKRSLRAEPMDKMLHSSRMPVGSAESRQIRLDRTPQRNAKLPLMTDLARRVTAHRPFQDDGYLRTPLHERQDEASLGAHRIRGGATLGTPSIKQAMLPPQGGLTPHKPPACRSTSRKSPKSKVTASHRLTPYKRPPMGAENK